MIEKYIKHGWKLCAVPHGTKGAITPGWQRHPLTVVPEGPTNVGLIHALSGTCALDIDDWLGASIWLARRNIDLDAILNAPSAVGIESGNPGHTKRLFQSWLTMPTKRVLEGGRVLFEMRCQGAQDLLPPSRHPSGTDYTWTGAGRWDALPTLPDALMALWLSLVEGTEHEQSHTGPPATPGEIESALMSISPDCSRQTWIEVGMALHTQGNHLELWDRWSGGSKTKYPGRRAVAKQWRSFKDSVPNGIGIGTLLHHARQAGWVRPPQDVSAMFKPLPLPPPVEQIVGELQVTFPLPTANLDLWPTVLVNRALELATEVGCDPIVPLVAGLLAVSGAANKQSVLHLSASWKVPPTIWAMTIGEPADKKTPGSRPMFSILRTLEHEDRVRYEMAMLKWQGEEARYAAQFKAYREFMATPESGLPGAVPPNVPTLPPEPKQTRLLISDATTQKIVGLAEGRPRGFLLYLDELNKWLSRLGDVRSTDDRGCWIQGYESGPYVMDRVGSGTIQVDNLAMSLYGNCQPEVFRQHLASASVDGLLQRFLPVVLNKSHNRMWQERIPEFMSATPAYEQSIRKIYACPKMDYALSADGMISFRSFCNWALEFRKHEQVLDASTVYQIALGKMEGNCGRLILLMHMLIDCYAPTIEVDTVRKTVEIFKKFLIPSLRYTYMEVGGQSNKIARRVFDLITQWSSTRTTVTLAEIRSTLGDLRGEPGMPAETWKLDLHLRTIMDDLGVRGYVSMYQDHPRFPVWAINPAVAVVFAEHREKIIVAKRHLIHQLTDHFRERTDVSRFPIAVGDSPEYYPHKNNPA